MAELTVVIPTFRRRDALPRALDALAGQTFTDFEVIVVDDPVDDDADAVRRAVAASRRPYSVRQLSRSGRGVSSARNTGWRAAASPLVMFIGDDILLGPVALAEHVRSHARRPDERIGVLGPVRWARELRVSGFMRWLEAGIQFDYGSLPGEEASWAHFYTSNVSVKRSMLERVDGFDEQRFPFLYEDLDVGYRMSAHGFRLEFNRRAGGEHLHETRLSDWQGRMEATGSAERRWVTLHPELPAYFHDRFAAAVEGPPGSRLAAHAVRVVPRRLPLVGPRVWASAERWYGRRLGPAFMAGWERGG